MHTHAMVIGFLPPYLSLMTPPITADINPNILKLRAFADANSTFIPGYIAWKYAGMKKRNAYSPRYLNMVAILTYLVVFFFITPVKDSPNSLRSLNLSFGGSVVYSMSFMYFKPAGYKGRSVRLSLSSVLCHVSFFFSLANFSSSSSSSS